MDFLLGDISDISSIRGGRGLRDLLTRNSFDLESRGNDADIKDWMNVHESIGLRTLVAIMVLALILFGPRRRFWN